MKHAGLLAQHANAIELRYASDQWSTLIDALASSRPQTNEVRLSRLPAIITAYAYTN